MSSCAVKGIIFDLDGTLYRMRWYMKPLLVAMLLPHGLRVQAYVGMRRRMAGRDFGTGAALMAALSEELGRTCGITADEARSWIVGPWYSAFVDVMALVRHGRAGVSESLRELAAKGVRLAVLSDFDRVRGRLERLGVDPALFDAVGSSEEFGCLKPGSRPFLQTAERFGLPPASVLVVGDRDDTDGAGARAAGMQFIRLRDGGGGGMSWKQLRAYLAGLPPAR